MMPVKLVMCRASHYCDNIRRLSCVIPQLTTKEKTKDPIQCIQLVSPVLLKLGQKDVFLVVSFTFL